MRHFTQIVSLPSNSRRTDAKRRPSKRAGLTFESLETRQLLSASPLANVTATKPATAAQVVPATTTIQNMTQLAQQMISSGKLKAPTGPTYLYINFDGWKANPDNSGNDITPFIGSAADIDSILYRTAEEFAPFDVIVQQISGNANYSKTPGATTIFVGNNLNGDFTPGGSMDYPHTGSSTSHVVNSDKYDFAYVSQDFQGLSTSIDRDASIANDIAHEAGHTFGLAHVRTDGQADFPTNPKNAVTYNPQNTPDVMSYDSNNDFFNNTTFNVTQANGSGVDASLFPDYQGTDITMQDSFTYLQTVLGARPATSQVGLTDENLTVPNSGFQTVNFVDPGYYAATARDQAATISSAATVNGALQTTGDYAAYQLSLANAPGWTPGQVLAISPGPASTPVTLMVFDTTFATDTAGLLVVASDFSTPIAFQPIAGHTYKLVVGGSASSTGAFNFTVGAVQLNLQGLNFTMAVSSGGTTGHLAVTSQLGSVVQGVFTPANGETPVNVTGFVGGAVNGVSAFRFYGTAYSATVSGPPQEQVKMQNYVSAIFNGQASLAASPAALIAGGGGVGGGGTGHVQVSYELNGAGAYTYTRAFTITDGSTTKHSTMTVADLTFTQGTAPIAGQTTSAASQTPATASAGGQAAGASPTRAAAVDLVMAGFGTTNMPTSDPNKRLTPTMPAFLT